MVAPRFIDQELAGSGYAAAVGGLQPPRYQSQRQESTVATLAISIVLPPTGELETTGDGSSPTQAQMDEEMKARSAFIEHRLALPQVAPGKVSTSGRERLARRTAGPRRLVRTQPLPAARHRRHRRSGHRAGTVSAPTARNSDIGPGRFQFPAGVAGASRNGRRPELRGGWSDGEGNDRVESWVVEESTIVPS